MKEKYLCKISLNAYDYYIEKKDNNSIVFEKVIGDQDGFLFVNKSDNGYSVYVAYKEGISAKVLDIILDEVWINIQYEEQDVYFYVCSVNKELISCLYSRGCKMVYPSFNMRLTRSDASISDVDIALTPYSNDQAVKYLDLLGKAFVPIREKLSLKPYNWYEENKEEAVKGFEISAANKTLFGFYQAEKLLGVIEVIKNELELIAVHPNYQGNGYGEKLLKKAISLVFDNEANETMTLGALQGNSKAEKLYVKEGFEVVASQTMLVKKASLN